MDWMRRHSRGIALCALTAMALPMLAGGLGNATNLPMVYWVVILLVVVGVLLTWKYLAQRSDR